MIRLSIPAIHRRISFHRSLKDAIPVKMISVNFLLPCIPLPPGSSLWAMAGALYSALPLPCDSAKSGEEKKEHGTITGKQLGMHRVFQRNCGKVIDPFSEANATEDLATTCRQIGGG